MRSTIVTWEDPFEAIVKIMKRGPGGSTSMCMFQHLFAYIYFTCDKHISPFIFHPNTRKTSIIFSSSAIYKLCSANTLITSNNNPIYQDQICKNVFHHGLHPLHQHLPLHGKPPPSHPIPNPLEKKSHSRLSPHSPHIPINPLSHKPPFANEPPPRSPPPSSWPCSPAQSAAS